MLLFWFEASLPTDHSCSGFQGLPCRFRFRSSYRVSSQTLPLGGSGRAGLKKWRSQISHRFSVLSSQWWLCLLHASRQVSGGSGRYLSSWSLGSMRWYLHASFVLEFYCSLAFVYTWVAPLNPVFNPLLLHHRYKQFSLGNRTFLFSCLDSNHTSVFP